MHCLLEGIGKRLFAIWLTPSAHAYSIGKHIQLLDKRLLSIKPPDTISRVPQAISNRKKWKGVVMALLCMHVYFTSLCMYTKHIQHRNLGLGCYIYCIPVLEGLLPPPYYDHLALLVCSMHILLGDNITSEGLSQAEGMLDEFYQKFEELYGKLASSCSFFLGLVGYSIVIRIYWRV